MTKMSAEAIQKRNEEKAQHRANCFNLIKKVALSSETAEEFTRVCLSVGDPTKESHNEVLVTTLSEVYAETKDYPFLESLFCCLFNDTFSCPKLTHFIVEHKTDTDTRNRLKDNNIHFTVGGAMRGTKIISDVPYYSIYMHICGVSCEGKCVCQKTDIVGKPCCSDFWNWLWDTIKKVDSYNALHRATFEYVYQQIDWDCVASALQE